MLTIAITSQDLEQLRGCQILLPLIIASQTHTHGCNIHVPQESVEVWDKVEELCDFLCRHWDEALEQKEKTTKALNLFVSLKVKRSIKTLRSAIVREGARRTTTDDECHRTEWEAKPEVVRLRSERAHIWKKIMAYDQEYPCDWAVPSPGVEAYRALSKLLELTKEKGWINNNGPGPLMNESELATLDHTIREHRDEVTMNLMEHLMFPRHKDKAEPGRHTKAIMARRKKEREGTT